MGIRKYYSELAVGVKKRCLEACADTLISVSSALCDLNIDPNLSKFKYHNLYLNFDKFGSILHYNNSVFFISSTQKQITQESI